jgi:hypothetical protein
MGKHRPLQEFWPHWCESVGERKIRGTANGEINRRGCQESGPTVTSWGSRSRRAGLKDVAEVAVLCRLPRRGTRESGGTHGRMMDC